MANRLFYNNAYSLEIDHTHLYAELVVGAAGAVTSGIGKGIASIVKETAAGQYTVNLTDSYNKLLHCDIMLLSATNSDPTTVAITGRLLSEDVVNSATPKLVIQGIALDDGAAANFASGAKVYIKITLRNSSVS